MRTQDARVTLDKMRMLAAELERRRADWRLDYYNTGPRVHHKQLAFHQCPKRNRWVFGGNRTGKTECGAVEVVYFARGNHPHRKIERPTQGWVVSLTNEVQRDVAQKKVLSYLRREWISDVVMRQGRKDDPENGTIDFIDVKSVHGGVSRIGFKSCDQGRAKFQGTSLDYVWFDEEPPREIYEECAMRVIDRQGDIWGTMTPLMGLTWVHDVIYLNLPQDPEVWCQSMQWEDNPFLRGEEIARLVATMSPQEREARQYGRFAGLAGLVYNAFSPDTHVIDPFDVPHAWYDNIAIDPGFTNPLSCHFYACDGDGNVYVVAEHYRAGAMVEEHACAIDAIARQLGWPRDGKGRLRALMDSAASQHTLAAERSVAELFYDHGIIPNLRVNKDKFTGIQRVKEYLKLRPAQDAAAWPRGKPRLFIFRTCPHMIREMQTYRWAIGEDAPQKVNDHAMDELRYYIMNRPEPYREPAPPKSAIALHKERLIAAARRNRRIT